LADAKNEFEEIDEIKTAFGKAYQFPERGLGKGNKAFYLSF